MISAPSRTLALVLLLLASLCGGCEDNDPPATGTKTEPGAVAQALPKLELRDDTKGILLTWLDDDGDFHVTQKISEVPTQARAQVRVVKTDREAGTGELLYVADLTAPGKDGSYHVKTMRRDAWDELGAAKRKKRLEAVRPPPPKQDAGAAAKDGSLTVIIYGADWCKPCHMAERYLKQRGIDVIMKDIDHSSVAQREMQDKLRRARRSGASIPVLDIGGQLLIGFNPQEIDQALKAAQRTSKL